MTSFTNKGRRLFALALFWLAAPTPAFAEGHGESRFAFFRYVREPDAAMIAFNPSTYDPRRPDAAARISDADLAADLAALRPAFDGLVLYVTTPDLTPRIVEAAARGFRAVLFGVWDPKSAAEIAAATDLIARYCRQLACALVIGNEGLNDDRYTLEDVARAAERVRAALPGDLAIPISTSEPSADYGWRPLRAFGDFLAPNIHPAIDQAARAPEEAAAWTRARARAIATVARKPVIVKETGLPNGGAPGFTAERQEAFWRSYLAPGRLATAPNAGTWIFQGIAFEAFDAPWKAEALHNPIEGHWSLFAPDRSAYPAVAAWRRAPVAPTGKP